MMLFLQEKLIDVTLTVCDGSENTINDFFFYMRKFFSLHMEFFSLKVVETVAISHLYHYFFYLWLYHLVTVCRLHIGPFLNK